MKKFHKCLEDKESCKADEVKTQVATALESIEDQAEKFCKLKESLKQLENKRVHDSIWLAWQMQIFYVYIFGYSLSSSAWFSDSITILTFTQRQCMI